MNLRARLDRLWLRFGPELEAEFLASVDPGVRQRARLLGILVMAYAPLYVAIGAVTDRPGLEGGPLAGTAVAMLLASMLVLHSYVDLDPLRRQQLQVVLGGSYVVAVVATVLSGTTAPEPYPFGGLVLVLFAIYFATGGDVYRNATVGLIGAVAYLVGAAAFDVHRADYRFEAMVVLAANVVGFVGGHLIEAQVRRSFLVRRRLSEQASTDVVTGLANRRGFADGIERVWAKARRDGGAVGVAAIDVDHLKAINDELGHDAGDRCLQAVAAELDRLRQHPLDVVARVGGDEFALVRFGAGRDELVADLERFLEHIRVASAAGQGERSTVSVGLVHLDEVPPDLQVTAVLDAADAGLYDVKAAGRDGLAVADHAVARRR